MGREKLKGEENRETAEKMGLRSLNREKSKAEGG